MKKLILGLVAIGALTAPASAQMVVIDHAALAKHLQTARNTLNQVQKAQQQIQEAQRLYGSFNKITDIKAVSGILNDEMVQRGLPADLGNSAKLLSSDLDRMGELGARAQELMRLRDLSVDGAISTADAAIALASRGAARDQSVAEASLAVAAARSEGLSRMADRLATATTAKEVMDLQARAAIESAAAQNQTNQLMALELGRQAEGRARNAASVAVSDRALRASIERDRARARSGR